MRETRFGMLAQVGLDLGPVPVVIANFLAVGTNGDILRVDGGLPDWEPANNLLALNDLTDVTTTATTGITHRFCRCKDKPAKCPFR